MGIHLRFAFTLVSLFALIGQMLLPVVHAESMARQGGDALASAFCGKVSSQQSLEPFTRSAPPELLAWLRKADRAKSAKPACDLCASVHGNHLAGTPSVSIPRIRMPDSPGLLRAAAGNEPVALVVLPPLRAPPALI